MEIRNFSIIAHIDHGKSTLADRLLEFTSAITTTHHEQVLDAMDLERERGITIKAKTVRLGYNKINEGKYQLNLIDTPGHVDFTYEVSRALAACEGCLLLVDASQGVEAQTLSNFELAKQHNLKIIPVINKIDLKQADVIKTRQQIEKILKISDEPILVSAKQNIGTKEIIDAIINKIPAPVGDIKKPLKALVFDSLYDSFRGVIIYIRIFDGEMYSGKKVFFFSSGEKFDVEEVGFFEIKNPSAPAGRHKTEKLSAGEVGYVILGIKDIHKIKIGDTITDAENPTAKAHPGYKELKPFVFCGLYPVQPGDYDALTKAMGKLHLEDSAFFYQPETSVALGFGYRCGFLGLLHMDIIKERLQREFGLNLIITAPNVRYRIKCIDGSKPVAGAKGDDAIMDIENPSKFPEKQYIEKIYEPYILSTLVLPAQYVGNVMALCENKRGDFLDMTYITEDKVKLTYEMPLADSIVDFYDNLKSVSSGYASFDYELSDYKESDLVKLDILVNNESVDALSFVVFRNNAEYYGRKIVEKLRGLIPRQMFEVPIQASIGGRIIARENVRALRKDVIAKCYGGDISRKRKLLEKQKEGKKKMKQFGNVSIPQEAFLAVLKLEE
ncbi:MAG: elongation factor 4 [Elusimicrobia bacterium RIFOXYC2_FULL_34_12]|nr:MAG: elongation factor 4 [Elusimicrobia bacterium RIFOXYC2_FULL_34_12]OGS38691.1 MAG: elongation factor 4 [Elusimicrobia bacterium RIFOXYD2_FULL_34_30]HAM39407.1 elongation factor 4 [Elusimicrobiota bacterium]